MLVFELFYRGVIDSARSTAERSGRSDHRVVSYVSHCLHLDSNKIWPFGQPFFVMFYIVYIFTVNTVYEWFRRAWGEVNARNR